MKNHFHKELLTEIKVRSGKGKSPEFLDSYLGTSHFRYQITTPALRNIAREWMKRNAHLDASKFVELLSSLIEGESLTEKSLAGILLGYSKKHQREFDPKYFDRWLDHVEGWAEIDGICTGRYTETHLLARWSEWKILFDKFSKSESIAKRRASLVLLCSAVGKVQDERFAKMAFKNIIRLQSEKSVLITKAISWLLRSMIKNYRDQVDAFVKEHSETLPKIAVRETLVKLKTGKKTKIRKPSKKKSNDR